MLLDNGWSPDVNQNGHSQPIVYTFSSLSPTNDRQDRRTVDLFQTELQCEAELNLDDEWEPLWSLELPLETCQSYLRTLETRIDQGSKGSFSFNVRAITHEINVDLPFPHVYKRFQEPGYGRILLNGRQQKSDQQYYHNTINFVPHLVNVACCVQGRPLFL
ncbi:hypothetical protein RhiJN_25823 [Ceratobasidium sp. AG-Ba]|nr:hypothetical protein RhiJN_25823 [Ceratobasidium sp. AG-Ba]